LPAVRVRREDSRSPSRIRSVAREP
jgi:hypothetical protein